MYMLARLSETFRSEKDNVKLTTGIRPLQLSEFESHQSLLGAS